VSSQQHDVGRERDEHRVDVHTVQDLDNHLSVFLPADLADDAGVGEKKVPVRSEEGASSTGVAHHRQRVSAQLHTQR